MQETVKPTNDANIMTAHDFFMHNLVQSSINEDGNYSLYDIENAMIEFAKLHVEAALEAAAFNAETRYIPYTDNDYEVDKRSIRNAYPLTNIK